MSPLFEVRHNDTNDAASLENAKALAQERPSPVAIDVLEHMRVIHHVERFGWERDTPFEIPRNDVERHVRELRVARHRNETEATQETHEPHMPPQSGVDR